MKRLVPAVIFLSLFTAACSGADEPPATPDQATTAEAPAAIDETTEPAPAGDPGSVDCSGFTEEDLGYYSLYVQLLAQVRTPEQAAGLRDQTFGEYTPAQFTEILDKFEVMRGHAFPGYDDPGVSIDYYRALNDAAAVIVAIEGTATQADLDAYATAAGGLENVIGKQMPLNLAISEYCGDL